MFHLAKALLCLFVVIRFILPLPWPRWLKLSLSFLLMVGFQHSLLSLLVFGTMFSPEVPRLAMIAVNWLAGSVLILAAFQASLDVLLLAIMALRWRRIRVYPSVRYLVGGLACVLAAYGVREAVRVPPIKEVEIVIRDLPIEFDGYRLVQLTDLHISRLFQAPWVSIVVALTNAMKADLIVITGDLIDGDIQARERDVAPLAQLSANDGVFAVPGNHEYYFGHDEWMQKYQSLGLRTISNSHVVLMRGDAKIVLAGVNDLTAHRFGAEGPDVVKALANAPRNTAIILLDHQPRDAATSAAAGVDLQLSGHTHGGMVWGFDSFIALFNNGYVSGLYDVDGMQLYVNNGTALWIGFALRLGVPSELTVLTLRKADS